MNVDRVSQLPDTVVKISWDSLRVFSNAVFKRSFDVLASGLGLILLSPLFVVIACLIRRENPGPVLYRGSRSAKNGKIFKILKFRTMYERPESYEGARITARDDKRITSIGRWLRDTKLNELPQLWNVLIGEMSLVGPRPEDPEIATRWNAAARREILSMLPGITIPASVLYHDEEALLSTANVMGQYLRDILPDKLRLDRLYVRNHSFVSDLDILFWTLASLILHITRQRIPEGFIFAGPISRLMRRHVSWFAIDWVIALICASMAGLAWRGLQPFNWGMQPLTGVALALAILFSGMNLAMGLDRIVWSRASAEDGLILALSNSMVTICLLNLNHLLPVPHWLQFPPLPAEMIVTIGVLTLLGSLAARYRLRLVSTFARRWSSNRGTALSLGERVLILGAGESGQIASWLLQRGGLQQAFSIIGLVDDDPAMQGMRVGGCWVLGGSGDLPALVKRYDVGIILFAITEISHEIQQQLIKMCTIPGVRLVFVHEILNSIQSHLTSKPSTRLGLVGMGLPSSQLGMRIYGMEK
jgi:lipopolysaccharide/colanic/teichoic acid biosynthesis glycosyltransferase